MTVRNLVQICYGVPGILSYFLVYWALISLRKQLSPSFFIIYCLLIATNMFAWMNSWFYLKLFSEQSTFYMYYEWMRALPFLVNTCTFLVSHFNYVQNQYLFFLTFDRYAAIISVTRNLKWWDKYHRWIIFLSHLVVLGAHMVIRLPMGISIKIDPSTGYYGIGRPDSEDIRNTLDANFRLGFGIFIFVICSILNILSYRILKKMKKTKTETIQRTFLAISMCIFATQTANVLIACLVAMFNTFHMSSCLALAYEGVSYFSDIYAIGPALYTIILPGLIRQFLLRKSKKLLRISTDESELPPSVIHDDHH